jgi:hypothetical protein
VKHLKGVSIGLALAFKENIRLGCKGWPRTNALAYYKYSKLTAVKSFITLALGPMLFKIKTKAKAKEARVFDPGKFSISYFVEAALTKKKVQCH